MRESLLEKLCCPACQGDLVLRDAIRADERDAPDEIRKGRLVCASQRKHAYAIDDGIACFGTEFEREGVKTEIAYEDRSYHGDARLTDPNFVGRLPDASGEVWPHTRHFGEDFRAAIDMLDLGPDRWTLDIGTAACWSSRMLAQRGGHVVALDVNGAPYYGLRAADIQFRAHGVYFDRVLESMTALPFRDGTFDNVAFNASFHHTPDLPRTLDEVFRVLKPSGRVVMASEEFVSLRHRVWRSEGGNDEGSHHDIAYSELDRAVKARGFYVAYCLSPHVQRRLESLAPRPLGGVLRRVVESMPLLSQQFTSTQVLLVRPE